MRRMRERQRSVCVCVCVQGSFGATMVTFSAAQALRCDPSIQSPFDLHVIFPSLTSNERAQTPSSPTPCPNPTPTLP